MEKRSIEKIICIRRVSCTTKGGRNASYSAMVVVGDGISRFGCSIASASEVLLATQKAVVRARKSMIKLPIKDGRLPHRVMARFCATRVIILPGKEGNGIKAGATMRAIFETLGIKDVTAKILGSTNAMNAAYATMIALQSIICYRYADH
jgi:small subunit ribosomal protein S5